MLKKFWEKIKMKNKRLIHYKRIIKKIISPFYYLPYKIELAVLKKISGPCILSETDLKHFLKDKDKKYIGVASCKRILDELQMNDDYKWLMDFPEEWVIASAVRQWKQDVFYLILAPFRHEKVAGELRKNGLIEGIQFISLLNGKVYRQQYRVNTVQKNWFDVEKLRKTNKEFWQERILKMSSMIDDNAKNILDLGCWECELEEYLPEGIQYYGCDYVKRREDTIVCDLNQYEFPQINFDVSYISGSLEYMKNLGWYFEQICKANLEVILSYSALEYFPLIEKRKNKSWVNHLTIIEIIEYMKEQGFTLETSDFWGKWTIILKFTR